MCFCADKVIFTGPMLPHSTEPCPQGRKSFLSDEENRWCTLIISHKVFVNYSPLSVVTTNESSNVWSRQVPSRSPCFKLNLSSERFSIIDTILIVQQIYLQATRSLYFFLNFMYQSHELISHLPGPFIFVMYQVEGLVLETLAIFTTF